MNKIKSKGKIGCVLLALALGAIAISYGIEKAQPADTVSTVPHDTNLPVIVLDAGHGECS